MLKAIRSGALFISFALQLLGQTSPGFQWVQSATGKHFEFPYAMAVDSQTNVYVTGAIGPVVKFGDQTMPGGTITTNVTPFGTFVQPNAVAFLAKYNPAGQLVWVLQNEGSISSAGRGLAVDSSDNVYLTGEFTGNAKFGTEALINTNDYPDVFLAKFNAQGTPLWLRKGGGDQTDWVSGLAVDFENNVYLTGYAAGEVKFGSLNGNTGTNEFGAARSSMYLVKFSPTGEAQWLRIPGGNGSSAGYAITARDGMIWVGGGLLGTNVFGRTIIVNTNSFQQNGFIAKYNNSGDFTSVSTLKGREGIWVNTLGFDAQGSLYVSGPFNGSVTLGSTTFQTTGNVYERFIARMNANGEYPWAKALGAAVNYNDGNLVGDDTGVMLVTGFTREFRHDTVSLNSTPPRPGNFAGGDLMVVKFDSTGKADWGVSGGGPFDDGGAVGARSGDGGLFVAGWFREQSIFGSIPINGEVTSTPQTDIFVTRLGLTKDVAPKLSIRFMGDGLVQVQWPLASGYILQETMSLIPSDWKPTSRTVSMVNGQNRVTIPINSSITRFFRLVK